VLDRCSSDLGVHDDGWGLVNASLPFSGAIRHSPS
jgi:hypothetical protein